MAKQVGEVSKSQLELAKFNMRSQAHLERMDETADNTTALIQELMVKLKEDKKARDLKKREL